MLLAIVASESRAQRSATLSVCRQQDYATLHSLPKLDYECPEDLSDSSDELLNLPARRIAIDRLVEELAKFNYAAWWQTNVDALNVCDLHGSAGSLSAEEKEKLQNGEYLFQLFGNQKLRLVLVPDPCYQRGYNGSILFLLNRNNGKAVVSQMLDGYYSRVDNSVGVAFAHWRGQQIIELETANSFPPGMTYYYFRIDQATGKATPQKLFKAGKKLTNEIYSAMLFGEPADFGMPNTAKELNVISGNELARTFSAYEEDERGKIDDNGRKLRRVVYRWNGHYYVRSAR